MIKLQVCVHGDTWITIAIFPDAAAARRDKENRQLFAMVVLPMRIHGD